MSLSTLLATASYTEDSATLEVTQDWLQGRSMFGGLQAALGVLAMRQQVGKEVPLKTLQTTFIAPIPAGMTTAKAKVLRAGKNAIQVEARIVDGEQTLALFIGVFGPSRPSAIQRTLEPAPLDDQEPINFDYVEGVNPTFTQHFASRWLEGNLPFTQHDIPKAVTEISMKEGGNTSESHFLAIADYIPPVALSLLSEPSPGSSLTWMLEFLVDDYSQQPLEKWRVDSEMTAASGGYTSQTATIYAPNGEAVALSRQSMVIFA